MTHNTFAGFRSTHMIPLFENLQVLELTFDIGMDRLVPANLGLIVSSLPAFAPRVEHITFTLATIPLIPEPPWVHNGLWPLFRAGFIERRDLPELRHVSCCLHITRIDDARNSEVSYEGFVTAMKQQLVGLSTDMLTFTQRDESYHWEKFP